MKNRLFEITLRTFIYPALLFENKIDSIVDLYKLEFSNQKKILRTKCYYQN